MKSNYDILGNHIRLIDTRNRESITDRVLGINIDKFFMPSVANVIGTDLSKYKLITKGKFACNPMHVGRDERLPVALYEFEYPDDKMIELSKRIKLIVDDKSRYTDWSARDDIKANLQVDLILLLDEFGYPPVTIDDVYKEVLEQAENFKKYAQ